MQTAENISKYHTLSTLFRMKFWKGIIEIYCIIPFVDQIVATSHCVAEKIKLYCGREAQIIYPILYEENTIHPTDFNDTNSDTPPLIKDTYPQFTIFSHGRLEPGK